MRKKRMIIISIAAALTLSVGGIAYAATTAGTAEDPLVTKSYIDSAIENVKKYIDSKVSDSSGGAPSPSTNGYEVLELEEGDTLLLGGGSTLILRTGGAKIIASENGGISDTTDGVDLQTDEAVPANHMLIIPRSDGRGIKCTTKVFAMVNGKYEIK